VLGCHHLPVSFLTGTVTAILLFLYLKAKFQARIKEDAKVKELIDVALRRLQEQVSVRDTAVLSIR
jgi:hypothetical protein